MDWSLKIGKEDAIKLIQAEQVRFDSIDDRESLSRQIRRLCTIIQRIFVVPQLIEELIQNRRLTFVSSWDPAEAKRLEQERFFGDIEKLREGAAEIIENISDFGLMKEGDYDMEVGIEKRNVFIVHGQNHGPRDALARLVHNLLKSEPIIIEEKPAVGLRSILDKIGEYSRKSSYAICILMPDDEGRSLIKEEKGYHKRARQNIYFEAGYLAGLLGRERVLLLKENEVVVPSDLNGIEYISLDKEDWKYQVARSLQIFWPEISLDDVI